MICNPWARITALENQLIEDHGLIVRLNQRLIEQDAKLEELRIEVTKPVAKEAKVSMIRDSDWLSRRRELERSYALEDK